MDRMLFKKGAIAALIAAVAASFWLFDLNQYISLEYIKSSRDHLVSLYQTRPAAVIAVYFMIYTGMAALSLPGAAILTLAGGAVFGLSAGIVIISFASTIGATLACSVSRFLLRDWLQRKFGERLKPVNDGIQKDGGFYLFTLRLIPAFPFWLVNLAMGLTKMPLGQFYLVSQAGMLPATIVYVNAGRELGRIHTLADILSPGLILSFALLGIFPLAAKKIVDLCRRGRNSRV